MIIPRRRSRPTNSLTSYDLDFSVYDDASSQAFFETSLDPVGDAVLRLRDLAVPDLPER